MARPIDLVVSLRSLSEVEAVFRDAVAGTRRPRQTVRRGGQAAQASRRA